MSDEFDDLDLTERDFYEMAGDAWLDEFDRMAEAGIPPSFEVFLHEWKHVPDSVETLATEYVRRIKERQ
jgi:hypothetical protein